MYGVCVRASIYVLLGFIVVPCVFFGIDEND